MKQRHSELYEGLLIPTGTRPSRPKLADLATLLRIARRGNSIEGLTAKATFEWIFTYARWLLVVLPGLIYLWSDGRLAHTSLLLVGAALIVNLAVLAGLHLAPWLTVRLDLLIRISELLLVSANVTLAHLVIGGLEFNAVYVVFLVIGAVGGGARRTLELGGIILFLMTASNTFAAGMMTDITLTHALVNVAIHAAIFALTSVTALFLFGRERQMSHYAHTDALTGLFNQRAFYPTLLHVAVMANERRRPASLILCDLDLFKQVNDTYGHDMGDLVLKEAASRLKACIPRSATACRVGGEEFAVVMPDTDSSEALVVAETIRQHISASPGPHGETITVSIGVSEWSESLERVDELVKRADEALYQAKAEGRNRTVISETA